VKRWKLAISLAVVAALAAPPVTGAWKLKPGGRQPLPVGERERIAKMAVETDNCTHFSPQNTEI
jgi:protein-L-isoaspartate O-methyltransferase